MACFSKDRQRVCFDTQQRAALRETGSTAAPAGVAGVNDSVTLAARNNNIITVRAIFHLSSLTPELLLSSFSTRSTLARAGSSLSISLH